MAKALGEMKWPLTVRGAVLVETMDGAMSRPSMARFLGLRCVPMLAPCARKGRFELLPEHTDYTSQLRRPMQPLNVPDFHFLQSRGHASLKEKVAKTSIAWSSKQGAVYRGSGSGRMPEQRDVRCCPERASGPGLAK